MYGVGTFAEGAIGSKSAIAIFQIWAETKVMARLVALIAHCFCNANVNSVKTFVHKCNVE